MRVVSLNLCTDLLLMHVADKAQIASLSFFSADPHFSLIADQIAGIPLNHGLAEEVLALKPDLVLTGTYTASYAVDHIRKQNIPVVTLAPTLDFNDIGQALMKVGEAVGHEARATEIVEDMRYRLMRLTQTKPQRQLTVMSYASGGATIGRPSLFDTIISKAGHINLPSELGMGSWAHMGLEGIITHRPDVILLEGLGQSDNSLTKQMMQHRALRNLRASGAMKLADVDSRLWACGSPDTVDAVVGFQKIGAAK